MAKPRKWGNWPWIILLGIGAFAVLSIAASGGEPARGLRLFLLLTLAVPVTVGVTLLLTLLPTAIHELGHVVAGRAAGFKLYYFHVGPFGYSPQSKPRWYLTKGSLTGGSASMVPIGHENLSRRFALMTAGGPIASLILTAVCVAIWLLSGQGRVMTMVVVVTALILLSSMLPMYYKGQPTDGMWLMLLGKPGARRDRAVAQMTITSETVAGLRPKDWPAELLESMRLPEDGTAAEGAAKLLTFYYHLDNEEMAPAGEAIDRAVAIADRLTDLLQNLRTAIWAEAAFYQAYVRRDSPGAKALLDKAGKVPRPIEIPWHRAMAAIAMVEGNTEEATSHVEQGCAKMREVHGDLKPNHLAEIELMQRVLDREKA